MPTPQRLPIVNSDDGTWGDIIRQYLLKEHYDDGTDNAVNGGHKNITVRAGVATSGGAPLKFTSGTLLTTPEAGAFEFAGDHFYATSTTGPTRKKLAIYDDTSGATGDIYYRNASGYFTRLGVGSSGDLLTVSSSLPSWTSSLVGKVLTDPKINSIKDSNGVSVVDIATTASAVNYLTIRNKAASGSPSIEATGSDTDISVLVQPKGTGTVKIYEATGQSAAQIQADGTATNVNLNLITKGTGVVQANGVELVNLSGTQTLTSKTLTAPKVNTLADTAGNTQFGTSSTDMSMSVDINMDGNFLWNLHPPVDPLDAATKDYVDSSIRKPDGNLVIGGDFQTDGQWVNAWGTQTTDQSLISGGKSHQITSTGAGVAVDYLSLTHDGTGTPIQIYALGERIFDFQINLRKKATNTGGGNLLIQTQYTSWSGTVSLLSSTISTASINNAGWNYWERIHTLSNSYKSIQFRIALDSSVPAGDIFYIGSALISDVSGGVNPLTTQTLGFKTLDNTNTATLKDTNFTIQDDGDATKQVKFQASSITTGTTRTLTIPDADTTIVGTDTVQTLTNKRVTPRINSTASSATPAINVDTTDQFNITALAANITSMTSSLTGTPVDGQKLMIRIKDNGTARTITWGASFQSSGIATLIATTVVSKTHHVGLIYDSAISKWVCLAVDEFGY